jgi:hypothetical protein
MQNEVEKAITDINIRHERVFIYSSQVCLDGGEDKSRNPNGVIEAADSTIIYHADVIKALGYRKK